MRKTQLVKAQEAKRRTADAFAAHETCFADLRAAIAAGATVEILELDSAFKDSAKEVFVSVAKEFLELDLLNDERVRDQRAKDQS